MSREPKAIHFHVAAATSSHAGRGYALGRCRDLRRHSDVSRISCCPSNFEVSFDCGWLRAPLSPDITPERWCASVLVKHHCQTDFASCVTHGVSAKDRCQAAPVLVSRSTQGWRLLFSGLFDAHVRSFHHLRRIGPVVFEQLLERCGGHRRH